jgi:hypothetical protein
MVRMLADDPSPAYIPHESAIIFATPDADLYRHSISPIPLTDIAPTSTLA